MADMEVTIWLGRESGHNLLVLPGLKVVVDDLADKIPRFNFAHEKITA
jgi:hypothetical protein